MCLTMHNLSCWGREKQLADTIITQELRLINEVAASKPMIIIISHVLGESMKRLESVEPNNCL